MIAEFLQLLLLIIIANGAPILIRMVLNDNLSLAVDFGIKLSDSNRLFGSSKTWRGILAALLATTIVATLLGYPAETGFLIAVYAVLGDLLSSFIKRRFAMAPSSKAPLLDQIPESLFPALMLMQIFNLETLSVILLVFFFTTIDMVVTHFLYHWRVFKKSF